MEEVGRFKLPPGFRFLPTDEELVLHFLIPKLTTTTSSSSSSSQYEYDPPIIIPNLSADHQQLDPWDLTGKALLSSANHFLFFDQMPRRIRTSRNGYWKDLHMEEPIFASGVQLATKKFFLFCRSSYGHGDEEEDQETCWIMEEYHLCPSNLSSNNLGNQRFEYDYSRILCRVHARKNCNTAQAYRGGDDGSDISSLDEMFLSLDHDDYLDDIYFPN